MGIKGIPKRFAVSGVGFFRVSGQNKQNLSKADTSLKKQIFLSRECPLLGGSAVTMTIINRELPT